MPSSTSNSDARRPIGAWRKTWALAVGLVVAFSSVVEHGLRAQGRLPWVGDDRDLWSSRRSKVVGDRSAIALIGTSRMHVGLATDVFRRRFPGRPIAQLAIDGAAPLPALRDLADDPDFRGLAICELVARNIFPEDDRSDQEEYVRHYRKVWNIARRVDRSLRTFFQERFVLLSPDLTPRSLASALAHRSWPKRSHVRMLADRSIIARYDWLTPDELSRSARSLYEKTERLFASTARPVSAEELSRRIEALNEPVRRIENRGGRVVLIRFPSSGPLRALEERYYPKRKYWDELARSTRAVAIHFEDVPALSRFRCPEGSHLGRADSIRFSEALADELVRRKAVRSPSEHGEHQILRGP